MSAESDAAEVIARFKREHPPTRPGAAEAYAAVDAHRAANGLPPVDWDRVEVDQ